MLDVICLRLQSIYLFIHSSRVVPVCVGTMVWGQRVSSPPPQYTLFYQPQMSLGFALLGQIFGQHATLPDPFQSGQWHKVKGETSFCLYHCPSLN